MNSYNDTFIALDLETTGLSASNDRIIEVGAVKFNHERIIDTFSTLVNPHVKLSRQIINLTGIRPADLEQAPDWEDVAPKLQTFLGDHALVGHNVAFDIDFMLANGIDLPPLSFDTLYIAHALIPNSKSGYKLEKLVDQFDIRIARSHRALDDAEATRELFLKLWEMIEGFPERIIRAIAGLGTEQPWSPGELANMVLEQRAVSGTNQINPKTQMTKLVNLEDIATNATYQPPNKDTERPESKEKGIDRESYLKTVHEIFAEDGILCSAMNNFSHREGQYRMAMSVATSMVDSGNLAIEAGTGIGKTFSYLIPAALYAVLNDSRVIISTHTLNLQDQLLNKDIEIVKKVIDRVIPEARLLYALLKGRSNYLCLNRWKRAIMSDDMPSADASLVSKLMLWLNTPTITGDKSEVSLGLLQRNFREYSAESFCFVERGEPCFLRKARYNARTSHIVIVNHSLLISDSVHTGGMLPSDGSIVIIDEAHNLKEVATKQLTESHSIFTIRDMLIRLNDTGGTLERTFIKLSQMSSTAEKADERANQIGQARELNNRQIIRVAREFFNHIGKLPLSMGGKMSSNRLLITPPIRSNELWKEVLQLWSELEEQIKAVVRVTGNIAKLLAELTEEEQQQDGVAQGLLAQLTEQNTAFQDLLHLGQRLTAQPVENYAYWIEQLLFDKDQSGSINSAPIKVDSILREKLFKRYDANVLVGATLSFNNDLSYFTNEVGLDDSNTAIIPSSFDFKNNVLALLVDDIPVGQVPAATQKAAQAIVATAKAVNGRTLVLFTSKSVLAKTYDTIREVLRTEELNLNIVAQGKDGSPSAIMEALRDNSQLIALGTNALWEGVDIGESQLDALIIRSLPFPVPTDPITMSRSALHSDSFNGYFIPEALKRFKQGFGRLIRTENQKGVFVLLDSRVVDKPYGEHFRKALPDCRRLRVKTSQVEAHIKKWQAERG